MLRRADEVDLLPVTIIEVICYMREPTCELLVRVLGETHEPTMGEVLQETSAEERCVVPTDADELTRLELMPALRDDDGLMIDRDTAIDDIKA